MMVSADIALAVALTSAFIVLELTGTWIASREHIGNTKPVQCMETTPNLGRNSGGPGNFKGSGVLKARHNSLRATRVILQEINLPTGSISFSRLDG